MKTSFMCKEIILYTVTILSCACMAAAMPDKEKEQWKIDNHCVKVSEHMLACINPWPSYYWEE